MIKKFYESFILSYPKISIFIVLSIVSLLAFNAKNLQIDASSDTLILKGDKDLEFLKTINQTYKTEDILVISYSPKDDLFDKNTLDTIETLSAKLLKLDEITSVVSILNVPLLLSPIMPISDLVDKVPTLQSKNIDFSLAKEEFLTSPFYKNNLVSKDLKTTALVLNLKDGITKEQNHLFIQNTRAILSSHQDSGELFLGGVNMISDDMIEYVKSDLRVYGSILLILMIFILWIIFNEFRWIALSVIICILSIASATGILGLFEWKITVISSNFISLQLIITISIVLHLIVRYRELCLIKSELSQKELILETILSKISPSFFAILTTIVGFASLIFSNILPVINLGWMMSSAILISLLIAFLFFPSFLMLFPKSKPYLKFEKKFSKVVDSFIFIIETKAFYIFLLTFFIVLFSFSGAVKLRVENSFIDYFKKDTDIYKGMKKIDENLGGTTPLDIIITFKEEKQKEKELKVDDEFADFAKEFEEQKNENQYWFTPTKMELIQKVHDYLDSLNELGAVHSLATTLKVGRILNKNQDLDNFQLALLYNQMPDNFKKIILSPYINIDKNQVRFTTRVIDSNKNLRRDELLKKIDKNLSLILKDKDTTHRLSNLMVLYNNMLQTLFNSQIVTLGFVAILLFITFIFIFRSLYIALVAMVTNIIPIGILFGLMGWFDIPLDMMSITIAAIGLGIGVDDTIHYIHRFKEELNTFEPIKAMRNSHKSIGYAMNYTTLVISLGFLVLIFSNFIPTIYFGLLTVIVMIAALLSALILLPKLLILIAKKGFI